MGVPAFYRWLSEKYPKIVQDVLEERVRLAPNSGSMRLPYDCTQPNPSGIECDNLYVDMNGIIHPCSHPEVGPQPTTEEEMYENVCNYVDRLFRVFRPRRLLYLAIDGVAPRAKMNQQRARRFRSAQEARELLELESAVREELTSNGERAPPPKKQQAWDSNVITPGTPFMIQLAAYVRFYIRKRISQDKAWRNIRVIFSDASLPGEGEHKIMSHIRLQRCQPGYNPNLVHVLHGLDADLIMLALATHEAHFYIAREEVLFGRKSQEEQDRRQLETGFRDAQRQLDEAAGAESMRLPENQQKPLQRISIPILREYLANEFAECLTPGRLPFAPSLERLIDDIVFLCFFVGNDFLPHLPSLDIRDGALDFLFNVYKRLLPGLGDYITRSGGNVNLSHVDVLLAEVGAIEDYVFSMKHENEQRERQRREQMQANKRKHSGPGPPLIQPVEQQKVRGRAAKILEKQEQTVAMPLSTRRETRPAMIKVSHRAKEENAAAAQALKESLGLTAVPVENDDKDVVTEIQSRKRSRAEDRNGDQIQANGGDSSIAEDAMQVDSNKGAKEKGIVREMEEEFDADEDDVDDDDYQGDDTLAADVDKPKLEDLVDAVVDPEAAKRFKEKVKIEQDKKLDEYSKNIEDKVRLHEAGWKDRYYSDKCKADDVENHGGREHLFRSYVMGLCWVMKYYYDGCPSWKWYYPFHYGPFASDLKNIERFEKDCKLFELSTPFNPVEQLMAVLPSDSAHAIPVASRWLMKDPESPIIDFYPKDVPVDPNGKAMPWLWVVLLPFIEEDRLLAALSPTMTDWSKTELFCNARGLDDGYLYVHKEHGLAKKFKTVLQNGKTAKEPKTKLSDAVAYGCPGFSGSVRPPLSNELFPVDEYSVVPRLDSADKITNVDGISIFADDIDPNDAVCVAFTEPSKLSHKSILLPGAKLAPPVLTAEDKRIRRPRLNRGGGSIANMGVSNGQSYQSGHGSMNIGTYERNLAQQTGRGADMYRTGNRAWGAMEPMPKRRTVPPEVTNPFMNQHGGGMNPGVIPTYGNQQVYQQQRSQLNSGAGAGQYQQLDYHRRDPQQQHQSYQNQNQPYREFAPHLQQQQQQHGFQSQPQPYRRQGPPPPPPPPPQQPHQGYQYPSHHQMNGSGLRQQQPISYPGNNYVGNGGRAGYGQGPPQNYTATGQPSQQQQNFNFRSLNQGPNLGHPQAQHGMNNGPPQVRRSRASADVMNSLRAQLSSTLNQKARNPNATSDQQNYRH